MIIKDEDLDKLIDDLIETKQKEYDKLERIVYGNNEISVERKMEISFDMSYLRGGITTLKSLKPAIFKLQFIKKEE